MIYNSYILLVVALAAYNTSMGNYSLLHAYYATIVAFIYTLASGMISLILL